MDARMKMLNSVSLIRDKIKEMSSVGIGKSDHKVIEELCTSIIHGMPTIKTLFEVRSLTKELSANMRDLNYAVNNDILTTAKVNEELSALKNTTSTLKTLIKELPEGFDKKKGIVAEANEQEPEVTSTIGTEVDTKLVNDYYTKTSRLPKSITKNNGIILLQKIPIVVLGIFGSPLEQLKRFIKIVSVMDGYSVFDKQYLLGFDTSVLAKQVEVKNEDKMWEFASETLNLINTKINTNKLALVSDTPRRLGNVLYYWVMPERILTRILKYTHHISDEWAFFSKHELQGDKANNSVTEIKIDLVFKMANAERPLQEIAVKTGLKIPLIQRLLSGEELADKTRQLREKRKKILKSRHSSLVDEVRKLPLTQQRTIK